MLAAPRVKPSNPRNEVHSQQELHHFLPAWTCQTSFRLSTQSDALSKVKWARRTAHQSIVVSDALVYYQQHYERSDLIDYLG